MTSTKLFLSAEYKSYLNNEIGLTVSTANQYVSYINSLENKFFSKKQECKNCISRIEKLAKNNPIKMGNILEALLAYVREAKYTRDESYLTYKELSDGHSALIRYAEFLQLEFGTLEETEINPSIENTENNDFLFLFPKVTIRKEDIYETLKFRLITQDRPSDKSILFPIRLINSFFCNKEIETNNTLPKAITYKEFIENWTRVLINHIEVLSEHYRFKLADIKQIEIMPELKKVFFVLETGERFEMYSHKDPNSNQRFPMGESMKSFNLQGITIEHIIPMFNILQDNIKYLEGLKRLSQLIEEKIKQHHLEQLSWKETTKLLCKLISFDEIRNIGMLLRHDLTFISQCSQLELMGSKYNINRGKN